MDIELLYYQECPSHEKALKRLFRAVAEEGLDVPVRVVEVKTDEEAEQLRFVGSPTIRVDGRDIDQPEPGPPYRLACRAYGLEDGRISPHPSEGMVRRALRAAIYTSQRGASKRRGGVK
jgi:hypothetical protein